LKRATEPSILAAKIILRHINAADDKEQKRSAKDLCAAFSVGFFDASERILVYMLFSKRKYANVEKYVADEGYGAQNMNDQEK